MASGPAHFAEAERLLAKAAKERMSLAADEAISAATVHAILAQAAAVAALLTLDGEQAWQEVLK